MVWGTREFTEHPTDIYSFERCMELKRYVPEVDKNFTHMAEVSKAWASFVEWWQRIEELIHDNRRRAAECLIETIASGELMCEQTVKEALAW
jgi:hypothetical protein